MAILGQTHKSLSYKGNLFQGQSVPLKDFALVHLTLIFYPKQRLTKLLTKKIKALNWCKTYVQVSY